MLSLDRQNELRDAYRSINPSWQPATELFAARVRNAIEPDSRILDLGCGRGGLVEQLQHPLANMVGVDPDWRSLREHRLALPRCAALGALPFVDGSFDVVYASWVLEHWVAPVRDLCEIGRILKPNGVFIFITPNKRAPLIRLNQVIGSVASTCSGQAETLQKQLVNRLYARAEADTFPVYYRANDYTTLNQLAIQADLTLNQLHHIPDPTYLAFNSMLFWMMAALEKLIPSKNKLHLVGIMQKVASG